MAYSYPLSGTFKVNSPYGWRTYTDENGNVVSGHHDGLDIDILSDDTSDPNIYAIADGVVVDVRTQSKSFGNMVVINHTDGASSLYGHMLKTPFVKIGQSVTAGTAIGIIGSTGKSTGVHLHIEIQSTHWSWNRENKLNPAEVLGISNTTGTRVTGTDFTPNYTPLNQIIKSTTNEGTTLSASTIPNSTTSTDIPTIDASGIVAGQRISGVTTTQPLHAFVNIYLGDNLIPLATDPAKPNVLVSFEYDRKEGTGESAKIVLFDDHWIEIEKLLSDYHDKIAIEYGYPGTGKKSQLIRHVISSYSLSFNSTGTMISLETITNGVAKNLQQQTVSLSSKASINPTEAVKEICRALEYEIRDEYFDASEDIDQSNDYKFTVIADYPIQYIQSNIIPLAKSAEGNAFSFYIDSQGYPHFREVKYREVPGDMRTYIWQKGYDSPVIELSFDAKGILGGTGDFSVATGYKSALIDLQSKKILSVQADKSSATTTATGTHTHTSSDQSHPYVDAAGYSPEQMATKLDVALKAFRYDAYKAHMTIIGDPTIELFDEIKIINITDSGALHATSGVYMVIGIVDSIQNGMLETRLELSRNAISNFSKGLTILNPHAYIIN